MENVLSNFVLFLGYVGGVLRFFAQMATANSKVNAMKILIVSHLYPMEGYSRGVYVHARAKIYKKKKHDVYVFVPSNLTENYNFEGIDVEWGSYSRLINCLRKFCPDVIALHSLTIFTQYHSLKVFKHLPIIAWLHGFSSIMTAFHGRYSPWQVKEKVRSLVIDPIKLFSLRRFMNKIYAPVYVSRWVQRMTQIYTCFHHKNSVVIPNPIDTALFKPANKKERELKKGLSVRDLAWKYGLDIAIKAYSRLNQANLTIIGTTLNPKNELFLRNLATRYQSNVIFITKAFNHNLMPTIYRKYDYFVNPARAEAQGVAMCEAMACGLPVIATNVGGTPEFVINGYNGFLATPNPVSIRNAIPKIIDNSTYRELSQNARRFVVKNLRAENLCQKEIDLMERAIKI